MKVQSYYGYLVQSRRVLWAFLELLPDVALAQVVLSGPRFHCIKDLLAHIYSVEDSWLHEDILRDTPVWESALENPQDGPFYADVPLKTLLEYGAAVERSTLLYLEYLQDSELERWVEVNGSKGQEYFRVEGLLWHVMNHETRHVAQIVLLIRQLGFVPPALDLINFLPTRQE